MQIFIVIVAIVLSTIALPTEKPIAVSEPTATQVKVPEEPDPLPTPVLAVETPIVQELKQEEPVKPVAVTKGNCYQWLIDAGVTDMINAVELQRRENASCNPQLYNMGGSDACGVAQELPCGKSGCGIPPNADGACQIRWMNGYVLGRYGSWAKAVQFHNTHNWY